jgi:hypothetical protein
MKRFFYKFCKFHDAREVAHYPDDAPDEKDENTPETHLTKKPLWKIALFRVW